MILLMICKYREKYSRILNYIYINIYVGFISRVGPQSGSRANSTSGGQFRQDHPTTRAEQGEQEMTTIGQEMTTLGQEMTILGQEMTTIGQEMTTLGQEMTTISF